MEKDFKEYLKLGSQYFRTWKKLKITSKSMIKIQRKSNKLQILKFFYELQKS